ncbi:tetraspanin-33-like isoform X1 [Ostrinia furnacalis]|uniref:tetraspanin-33-like isoform X1 n=1 Tax=Ostrinia furnacalis TaxID=93504 RepID=UPI00103BA592|nr:tetraspanin-33-like isoform X1 [Ostrinia furnacalis]
MHRRRGPNFTYVSGCVKYMIFALNFIFWLFGGLLIGVGLYAFIDKWQATGLIKLDTVYDVMLNISLLIALLGGVVFVVSFAGCVGALRENTCLLKFYSLCLLILFLVEMGGAVCGFVFPRSLHGLLELSFTERVVHAYRDDPDLQNFIDFAQSDVSTQFCRLLKGTEVSLSSKTRTRRSERYHHHFRFLNLVNPGPSV